MLRFVSGRHVGEIVERLPGRKLLGGSWEPLRNILGSLGGSLEILGKERFLGGS